MDSDSDEFHNRSVIGAKKVPKKKRPASKRKVYKEDIRSNLIGVEPDPAKIAFDMPVQLVYKDALGRKDKKGNSYLSYFFAPRGSSN